MQGQPGSNLEISELHHSSTTFYMEKLLECIFCSTLLIVTFDVIQDFSDVTYKYFPVFDRFDEQQKKIWRLFFPHDLFIHYLHYKHNSSYFKPKNK